MKTYEVTSILVEALPGGPKVTYKLFEPATGEFQSVQTSSVIMLAAAPSLFGREVTAEAGEDGRWTWEFEVWSYLRRVELGTKYRGEQCVPEVLADINDNLVTLVGDTTAAVSDLVNKVGHASLLKIRDTGEGLPVLLGLGD